ncbi:MAG TPA: hypothetical protein VFZ27_16235 [Terriglobia bacterium]|nr:hypothetical protein [Terriglobia bacterium]
MWQARLQDWKRHVHDLQTQSYEGAASRAEKEQVFRRAFDLTTPVAVKVLAELNACYLENTGRVSVHPAGPDGEGGLLGSWQLVWPALLAAKSRFTGRELEPVALTAIFPLTPSQGLPWTHPHLALLRAALPIKIAAAWPFQVTSEADAQRQEPILRVLAEAEMHERTFEGDLNWRILPVMLK